MATVGDKRDLDGNTATVVVAVPDVNGRIVVDVEGGGYFAIAAADFDARPDIDDRIPTARTAWIAVEPNLDIAAAALHRTEAEARAAASADALGVLEVALNWRQAEPLTTR